MVKCHKCGKESSGYFKDGLGPWVFSNCGCLMPASDTPITVDGITKLRRRCEDALRKSTPEMIEKVAAILEVK